MKKTISTLAAITAMIVALPNQSNAGDCHYDFAGDKTICAEPVQCCFSYDYIDVAYMSSDYGTGVNPLVLNGTLQTAPNGSIVDELKGVNVEFRKSLGCNFYFAGEFYNTDGFLAPELTNVAPNLAGQRAEFYYYRAGLGFHHSLANNLDFTFDAGGLFTDCQVPNKLQDEWGWYVSPGLRLCLGGLGELYANYMYESFETMENHRFDGGAIIPVADCLSLKLGGRYETEFEKTSFLAGIRFNY